jgi:16S rRNA (uracil1498-N3)-methyltransferase
LPRARLVVVPLPSEGETARLSREEAAHARARRLREGDPVVLIDGSGREALAVLRRLDRGTAEVAVDSVRKAPPSGPPLALSVCGLRIERLAWLAEKATELSADRLTIVSSQRTQSFRASRGVLERLERVAREAAKQCESARWPEIAGPVSLENALAESPSSQRVFLDARGEAFPSQLAARPVALLVGPEGGWTEAERAAARASGWALAALPAAKLRAETAAVAALVLARAALAAAKEERAARRTPRESDR